MKVKIELTHKGWFGLCPVYIGDPDGEMPMIDPRHWAFSPLLWFSEFLFFICIELILLAKPDAEPGYPLSITGKLRRPIVEWWEQGDE